MEKIVRLGIKKLDKVVKPNVFKALDARNTTLN